MTRLTRRLPILLAVFALAGCGSDGAGIDSTPEKLDGTESHEFEQDDLDAAAGASDAVKEYCADAVSEAQRLGCESHVTDADLPLSGPVGGQPAPRGAYMITATPNRQTAAPAMS